MPSVEVTVALGSLPCVGTAREPSEAGQKTTISPNATAWNTMSVQTWHLYPFSAMPMNTQSNCHTQNSNHITAFASAVALTLTLGVALAISLRASSGSATLCHGCALYTAPAGNDWQDVDRAGTRAKPHVQHFNIFYDVHSLDIDRNVRKCNSDHSTSDTAGDLAFSQRRRHNAGK